LRLLEFAPARQWGTCPSRVQSVHVVPEEIGPFSVIIPARNAATFIAACIRSVKALSPGPEEIIVVDDASEDATGAIAASKGAKVIRSEVNVGPGIARNIGAAAAVGDLLAFTDSDCQVPPSWLRGFIEALKDGRNCAATGPYAGTTHSKLLTLLIDRSLRYDQRGLPDEIHSCITSNFCVRKSDFNSVGGFPTYRLSRSGTYYFGNEDEELAHLLVTKTAKTVRWLRDNGVYHGYRATLRGYFRQQARYAEAIIVSYARFPAMLTGTSNYSRSGSAMKVIATSLAIAAVVVTPLTPNALWGTTPFLIANFGCVAYIVKSEQQSRSRKMAMALAGYPFLLFTAIAWLTGLAVGATKGLAGIVYWRRSENPRLAG
jgi:glycosyltransferase involved in cell wall biosynthesis